MKQKILAIGTLVILSGMASYAQTSPKSSLFAKIGLNLSNITVNKDGRLDDGKGIASFHAGLQADLQ